MFSIGLLNRPWRQGRKVGRNIYAQLGEAADDRDVIIGQMDSEWLAADIVVRHNQGLANWDAECAEFGCDGQETDQP